MAEAKPKLLFISSNDGSDMRINKELLTLSRKFEITFIGVGTSNIDSFAADYCKFFYLIIGKRNHPVTILKQFFLVAKLIGSFKTVHIINEQLMIFFYPLLFRKHVVLDIFDSIFLTLNKAGEKWKLLKKLIYAPVNKILVTDENRKSLMPSFTWSKIEVLENYPNKYAGEKRKKYTNYVTILYNGWMGVNRGTEIIEKLMMSHRPFKYIMAGWFADKRSKQLTLHQDVDYRGILPQSEALKIAADEADYVLCVYAPLNENNINASPNKIYDAIQTGTPVIINTEIKISEFVVENKLGVVLNEYDIKNPDEIADLLYTLKGSFQFEPELVNKYTWEQIESILLNAHQI